MADEGAALDPISRQRIDLAELPDGSVEATLTATLPDGSEHRFVAVVDEDEVTELAQALIDADGPPVVAGHEVGRKFTRADYLKLTPAQRAEVDAQFNKLGWAGKMVLRKLQGKSGGFLSGIGKAFKSIASSKVFKIAAKGLAIIAPALGPLAPAALGAAGAMGVASHLASAGNAASAGLKVAAKALTGAAVNDAKRLTKTPQAAASLLKIANAKRKGAEAIAEGKPTPRSSPPARPTPRPAPAPARAAAPKPAARPALPPPRSGADVIAAARAGRLRSNKGGAVSRSALLAAHNAGRVFWLS